MAAPQSGSPAPEPVGLAAACPADQAARLAALHSYGILDTPREGAFDDITRIAAHVCQAPIAVVNLIDESRQWFKSEIGLGVRETPLDTSFCAHAILESDYLEIGDATRDRRFRCNPLVTGALGLRFYAGALLKDASGHALGTICVLDTRPRELDDDQRAVLHALARQTMAQLELRRALLRAERARRYRSRLMAIAGHDLMQPLSVITVVLHELRRTERDAAQAEQIALAATAAHTLDHDLTRLAQASRDDADQDEPVLGAVILDEVLDLVRDNWSFAASRKGLALEIANCPLTVQGDPTLLRTLLDNLLGNAIKYTERGHVRLQARGSAGGVQVEVSDTGIGIPEHLREAIFEDFRQADPRSSGLGLGLSIARRSAEIMGCRLTVASQPGVGSCFTAWIPAAEPVDVATQS